MYTNTIWVSVITMTTVGYGDITLFSPMGRVIAVVLALWGGIIESMCIITILEQLTLRYSEQKSLDILNSMVKTQDVH